MTFCAVRVMALLIYAAPGGSMPMTRLSPSKWYGGTGRLAGAGFDFSTRPAMSYFDLWQGQKKPPFQSGSNGSGLTSECSSGAQPRWVQTPISTSTSGLSERCSFCAYLG